MMAELYVTKVSLSIKKGHFQNGDVLFYESNDVGAGYPNPHII